MQLSAFGCRAERYFDSAQHKDPAKCKAFDAGEFLVLSVVEVAPLKCKSSAVGWSFLRQHAMSRVFFI